MPDIEHNSVSPIDRKNPKTFANRSPIPDLHERLLPCHAFIRVMSMSRVRARGGKGQEPEAGRRGEKGGEREF